MYQRILVPVDGSPTASRGLDESIRLARLTGGRIRLVHVIDNLVFSTGMEWSTVDIIGLLQEAGAKILQEARARVEAAGIAVETHLSEAIGSRVCDVVVAEAAAWRADVVVIGTHGRRGIGRLVIGSDAEQIVRSSPVPVLLVRGAEAPAAAAASTTKTGQPAQAVPA